MWYRTGMSFFSWEGLRMLLRTLSSWTIRSTRKLPSCTIRTSGQGVSSLKREGPLHFSISRFAQHSRGSMPLVYGETGSNIMYKQLDISYESRLKASYLVNQSLYLGVVRQELSIWAVDTPKLLNHLTVALLPDAVQIVDSVPHLLSHEEQRFTAGGQFV